MAQRIIDHSVSIEDLEKQQKILDSSTDTESQKESTSEGETSSKKSKKAKNKKVRGAGYKEAKKNIDKNKDYSLDEALKLLREFSYTNFNESVETHINLGTDVQNTDHRIRFTTTLPHGIGKEIKILVISDDNSGIKKNIIYRDSSVADDIFKGKLSPDKDFNVVISHPKFMKDIAKVAKILGPKGMMPSPKNETVTENIDKALENLSKGQIEIKSQPGHAVIHQLVGNLSFTDTQLKENIEYLIKELNKNTPPKMKKRLVQKVFITTTMSPSIRIKAE